MSEHRTSVGRFGETEQPPTSPTDGGIPIEAYVDAAVTTDDGRLLVVGWAARGAEDVEVWVESDAEPVATETVVVRGRRPDVAAHLGCDDDTPLGFVLITGGVSDPAAARKFVLRLRSGARERRLGVEPRPGLVTDVFGSVSSFTRSEREALQKALGLGRRRSVAPAGVEVPEELRPDGLSAFVRVQVERALCFPGRGLFVRGWLLDPANAVQKIALHCGAARCDDILPALVRFERGDVAAEYPGRDGAVRHGFFAFLPMAVAGGETELSLVLTTIDDEVAVRRDPVQACSGTAVSLLAAVLSDFSPDTAASEEVLRRSVLPAVEGVWAEVRRTPVTARAQDFGSLPEAPRFSVVVPLYGRVDFLMHQVAQFSRDDEFSRVELVYVVDDPTVRDEAVRLAGDVHRLFRTPFRLVELSRNAGYATATNMGVRHSTAERLVLLNSDVLPGRPGWLGRLAVAQDSLERVGAVAPRLLFYDDTVQHDGISFAFGETFPGIWLNEHPGKGLPKWLAPEPSLAEVPAVTGACLMIARALYDELGGLDEGYVLGDFEDTDLCLKARQVGYRCCVVRGEELYHLERQSFSTLGGGGWRHSLTLCNALRHQDRWGDWLGGMGAAATAS